MKVLVQAWVSPSSGSITSISKNRRQIRSALTRVKKEDPSVKLEGKPYGITIPDDSPFAGMVEDDAVFLHQDEMGIIYDSPENK